MHFMFLPLCIIIEIMEEKLTITAIEPQKRKKERYNIFADGEYVASLGAEAIVRMNMETGAAVSRSALDAAALEDNVQYAFDCAASLLSHSMRTRGELVQRLREKGVADAAIEPAMDKLTSYGYVDDSAYAREFVRSAAAAGRWGRIAVSHRLQEKRLDRALIADAMAAYTDEDEMRNARRQLDALMSKSTGDARKLKQKAFAALTRHGFSYDTISALFSGVSDDAQGEFTEADE
jgi:regulatory protein